MCFGSSLLKPFRLVIAVVSVACFLYGCDTSPERPITVGTNVWPGYESGYLAERRGFYGEAIVQMRQFQSATEVLRAFRNGSVDVAALTLDEAIMLQARGIPIKIILVADVSHGADSIVARPEIASVRDLAGDRVGVENSALGDYVLARALQIHGLPDASVQPIAITVDETVDAYLRSDVAAVVTFEPYTSRLIELGGRKLFDSRQMPDEIVDVLVVREELANDAPNAIRAVVKGWLKGAEVISQQEPTAMKEVGARLGLNHDRLRQVLSELRIVGLIQNQSFLSEDGPLAQSSRKLVPVLEKRNGMKLGFDVSGLGTQEFLPDRLPK